jgi:sugar/nucleoside kinase (ribokinase family)
MAGNDHVRPAPIGIVGNLNVDQWIQTVERFPVWDEEIVVDSVRLELAGTAGYLLLASEALGIPAVTVSAIGDDAFGAFLQEELRAIGAEMRGIEVLPGRETCLGMIFVSEGGHRAIMGTLGAHAEMSVAVADRHDERIADCAEVVICGTYLLPKFGPAEAMPYARRLGQRGQIVAFDPSWDPAGWIAETRAGTLALLAEVDVYLPNETELLHLTGDSRLDAAVELVAGLAGEVVVKRGADGALFARGEERVSVRGFPIEAVNTIGAGDVFDAAYLYARRQGWAPEQRLRFANALAAMVVSQHGKRVYPDAAAVEAFIQAHAADGHTLVGGQHDAARAHA